MKRITCTKQENVSLEKVISYPNPVPLFPGFVKKFLPEDLNGLPGLACGLKADIGPLNVP
jgi:hypothetical protein